MGLRSGRRSFGLRLEGNLVFGTALVIPSCSLNKKSAPVQTGALFRGI